MQQQPASIMVLFLVAFILSVAVAAPCSIDHVYNTTVSQHESILPYSLIESDGFCILLGYLYNGNQPNGLFALDFSRGVHLWTLPVSPQESPYRFGSSERLRETLILLSQWMNTTTTCSVVRAVHLRSGRIEWTRDFCGPTARFPVMDVVIIPPRPGTAAFIVVGGGGIPLWYVLALNGQIVSQYTPSAAAFASQFDALDDGREGLFAVSGYISSPYAAVFHVRADGQIVALWSSYSVLPADGVYTNPLINNTVGSPAYSTVNAWTGVGIWHGLFTGKQFLSPAWPTGVPPITLQDAADNIIVTQLDERHLIFAAFATSAEHTQGIFGLGTFDERSHTIVAESPIVTVELGDAALQETNLNLRDFYQFKHFRSFQQAANSSCGAFGQLQVVRNNEELWILFQFGPEVFVFDAYSLKIMLNTTIPQSPDCTYGSFAVSNDGSYIKIPFQSGWVGGAPPFTRQEQDIHAE